MGNRWKERERKTARDFKWEREGAKASQRLVWKLQSAFSGIGLRSQQSFKMTTQCHLMSQSLTLLFCCGWFDQSYWVLLVWKVWFEMKQVGLDIPTGWVLHKQCLQKSEKKSLLILESPPVSTEWFNFPMFVSHSASLFVLYTAHACHKCVPLCVFVIGLRSPVLNVL